MHDAQIPNAILPDHPLHASLKEVLAPIKIPLTHSPPPALDRPMTEEVEEGCETGNEHANATTSFGLGSSENPILIDVDHEGGDSQPGSAQHPILIEGQDAVSQSDEPVFVALKPENGSRMAAIFKSTVQPPTPLACRTLVAKSSW